MREEGARAELRLKMICHTNARTIIFRFLLCEKFKKVFTQRVGSELYGNLTLYNLPLFYVHVSPPPSSPLKMSNCIIHMCFMCFANKYCLVYKLDFVYSS